jgi:hypothetical protein
VLLFTVGGGTRYAWLGPVEGKLPPLPVTEWLVFPAGFEIGSRDAYDPAPWMLVARCADGEAGLAPLASVAVPTLREAGPLQARTDVVAQALTLPAALQRKAVAAVAAGGNDLWGVVDGVVHDLRTGRPLHAPEPTRVTHMAATPHGLVLLTRCGRLATLRDGALVLGAFVGDATLAVAPAPGPAPAVWL